MRSRIELRCQMSSQRGPGRISPLWLRALGRRLEKSARLVGIGVAAPAPVTVSIVDLEQMSELHERWMGLAGPTDVLSMPSATIPGSQSVGDIVLCWPFIQAQAQAGAAQNALHEATVLGVHGLLHLCGHDHRNARQSRHMHRQELRILARLAVPDLPRPYVRPRP